MKGDGGRGSEGGAAATGAHAPDAGGQAPAGGASAGVGSAAGAPFRTTLAKVLLIQVVALALLWLLQSTFHG